MAKGIRFPCECREVLACPRIDKFPEYRSSGLKWTLQSEHRLGDLSRLRTAKTHDTDAATPRWSGNGDDGVVKLHP